MFAIKPAVAGQRIECLSGMSFSSDPVKLKIVRRGADARNHAQTDVRCGMHDRPELGKFTLLSAAPAREVVADVPGLHPCGVNASQACLVGLIVPGTFQQSGLARLLDVHVEQAGDGTFFSNRFSA